jgi:hypothetical protein
MVSTKAQYSLLNKVPSVAVSDTTGDAMNYNSWLQKNTLTKSLAAPSPVKTPKCENIPNP